MQVEYHDNCGYDFVEVRDGLELHSRFLARLCGYKPPEEVRSTSNHMLVRFFSDSSVLKMGFSATFVTGRASFSSLFPIIGLCKMSQKGMTVFEI